MKEENKKEYQPKDFQPRKKLTFSQKTADNLAKVMGSWAFIIIFFFFLAGWVVLNVFAWIGSWDPYPFIFLNLALSCLAAIQAPIILMSQNRQAECDRAMAEYDYSVNRKAEHEIRDIQVDLEEIKNLIKDLKKS